MHSKVASNGPPSICTCQNEPIRRQLLNEETALVLPTRHADEKPHLLYTVYGTNFDVTLYKRTVVNFVEKEERNDISTSLSHLFILTSYFLLQNEYKGKSFLSSAVKDALIPFISGMKVEDLKIFWDALKNRIPLSVNHCIDGNSATRRYLPLRDPIKHNIPMSLDLFVSACLLELQRIQHHHITQNLTLKHILCEENDFLLYKLMRRELSGTSFLIYCKQFSKFSRFKEIIEEQLRRVEARMILMQILEGTSIHTNQSGSKIISLTGDCVKYVVEYLSNEEIKNMIFAFKTNNG